MQQIPLSDNDKDKARKYCIYAEQQAYDTLKRIWDHVSPPAKATCLNKKYFPNMDNYRVLEMCIDTQVQYEWNLDRARRESQDSFRP